KGARDERPQSRPRREPAADRPRRDRRARHRRGADLQRQHLPAHRRPRVRISVHHPRPGRRPADRPRAVPGGRRAVGPGQPDPGDPPAPRGLTIPARGGPLRPSPAPDREEPHDHHDDALQRHSRPRRVHRPRNRPVAAGRRHRRARRPPTLRADRAARARRRRLRVRGRRDPPRRVRPL
ncbi:unnamed protein product, partial [Penicillium discolor]